VHMGPLRWAQLMGFALLNWLYDCFVLIASLEALRIPVPWRGIFVIYGLTQIAATIPITPGGLGVVEGGLVALLQAYGVPTEQAFAGTIVYRIVSFWGLVPIGWAVWVALDVMQRRGLRTGRAHPWAFHRHTRSDLLGPSPAKLRALPEPSPCDGCDHSDGETLAVEEPSTWTAGRSA
jgi:Lysylphosphatidylglycerol synthase TM region